MAVKTGWRDTSLATLIPADSDPLAAPRIVSAAADTEGGGAVAPKGDGEPMNSPTLVPPLESEVPTGIEAGWIS